MEKTDTVVIGAGPGGYVAAIRAAQLGQKVTIIEAAEIGGVCLNVGCIPSKALITAGHRFQEMQKSTFLGIKSNEVSMDFEKTQNWKNNKVVKTLTAGVMALLKKNNVRIVKGQAVFTGKHALEIVTKQGKESLSFSSAIVATGSRPIEMSGFRFEGRVLDSTGALNLKEVPKNLLIIGGGVIGAELGSAYANLGTKVTIVEGSPSILPNFEADIQQLVRKNFKKRAIEIYTNASAKKVINTSDGVRIAIEKNGEIENIEADYVMVTVGRKPNTDNLGLEKIGVTLTKGGLVKVDDQYRTEQPTIFAIGDIVPGPALAHKASYEAKVAAEAIALKKTVKDYHAMPIICYTDPEVATVGDTLAEAKQKGIQAKTATFPMQANGRALTIDAEEGFVRLVFEKETTLILGAQIVGTNASERITEIAVAIEAYLTLEDIALTIHGHPTLAEMVSDAAEIGLDLPINF